MKQLKMILQSIACITLLAGFHQANAATELYFVHNDHLGTPQVITDQNQTVVWEGRQKPFGETEITTSTVDNDARFPGQYYDKESGLHYNYFRDYDPTIGRYIQSDPIGLNGGINTYGYVGGNPLAYYDSLGLFSTEAHNYLIQQFGQQNDWSSSKIKAVQSGSLFADNPFQGNQRGINAHMHAMTSSAIPNKAEACRKANEFISQKIKKFKNFGGGDSNNTRNNFIANNALGMALHTVMDNRSPAHAGFQKWAWNAATVARHGDNTFVPYFGSKTEEDLDSLLSNPGLVDLIMGDMANLVNNGSYIDCSCYQ